MIILNFTLFMGRTTQQHLCKFSKLTYKFNAVSIRLLARFVTELDRYVLECVWDIKYAQTAQIAMDKKSKEVKQTR